MSGSKMCELKSSKSVSSDRRRPPFRRYTLDTYGTFHTPLVITTVFRQEALSSIKRQSTDNCSSLMPQHRDTCIIPFPRPFIVLWLFGCYKELWHVNRTKLEQLTLGVFELCPHSPPIWRNSRRDSGHPRSCSTIDQHELSLVPQSDYKIRGENIKDWDNIRPSLFFIWPRAASMKPCM